MRFNDAGMLLHAVRTADDAEVRRVSYSDGPSSRLPAGDM